jgi:hypothetical protein
MHFINLYVKNQQMQQLLIKLINYVRYYIAILRERF